MMAALPKFEGPYFCDKRLAKLFESDAATVHEALGRSGALPSAIKPICASMRLCGRACTVKTPPRSNLSIHQAIYLARPGDVLVVDAGGYFDAGYWGEILNTAAILRKLNGLVIDAGVRDTAHLEAQQFPVFARAASIRGTEKYEGGVIGSPVLLGETYVRTGDFILGDRDGVVAVPEGSLDGLLDLAAMRRTKEEQILSNLAKGHSTLELYGFDAGSFLDAPKESLI